MRASSFHHTTYTTRSLYTSINSISHHHLHSSSIYTTCNSKMNKIHSIISLLFVLLLALIDCNHADTPLMNSPAPAPTPAPQPLHGTTQGSLQPQECGPRCTVRCSKTAFKKPCMFFCQKCCSTCLCVPSGTYGNKQTCPCYNNWKTKRGGPKCP